MAKEALQKEVSIKLGKKPFSGPFKCHSMKTVLKSRKMNLYNNMFSYSVWQCPKCKEEYLDTEQAKKLESIWLYEKMVNNNLLSVERSINYDGKMFFLRFPKELTKDWKKGENAKIKVLDKRKFIVEVE